MLAKRLAPCLVLSLLLGVLLSMPAAGQCILANPSFELDGSGGSVFGGWGQFGSVGESAEAVHGSQAARVSGPDSGIWDTSGFWQTQDCEIGEQWDITGHVSHPAANPLTGECVAYVAVEWRDGVGQLIDDEVFTVADASTLTDQYVDFSLQSSPAPDGTATIVVAFAVLQSPTAPSPDVYYDQVTVYSTTPPTIDDVQWNDFPNSRRIDFGGHSWRVKGPGIYGPGNNYFSFIPTDVWVDDDGLHLTVKYQGGTWTSTEVVTEEALGYGDYIVTTASRLDQIDIQTVLGIFLWEYGPCWDYGYLWWNAFNEIDIEYSRWGNPGNGVAQFVAQPYDYPGNIDRFDPVFGDGEVASHAMRWLPDRVEYRVWRGGPDDESPETMVHAWTYTGPHISRPEQPRLHLNFWKLEGTPASDQEIVFQDFTFVPEGPVAVDDEPVIGGLPGARSVRLLPASPNPFNPQTTLRYVLLRDGSTELAVYDMTGRRVRTLHDGFLAAGEHRATWNGLDDSGQALASGVYLVRLRGRDYVETRRVALIK